MRNCAKRGVTLIEAMIVVLLVGILAVALVGFFPLYKQFVIRPGTQLMAAFLAQETMEKLYWQANIATTSSPVNDTLPPGALGSAPNPRRDYSVDNSQSGNYSIVTVTVGWN